MSKTLTEQQIIKIIENVTRKAAKVCEQKFYDKPKSLTEQWREGTLPDGYYYINYDTQQKIFEIEDGCATYQGLPAETYFLNDVCLIKVLGPVPSYDEYKELVSKTDELVQKIHILNEQNTKQYNELCEEIKKNNKLEKKLEIATKALKEIEEHTKELSLPSYTGMLCNKALKEMEGVK